MSDHDGGHAAKHPRLAELEAMVRDGRIDTIVVAFTDMQGRLMGKRVHGQAFLDGVIDHGAHFCTYLLGTDMEMNTPEGFKLMNWETGYGDWIAQPIWDQLRELPWLPGTAMVLSDTIDEETGEEIPVSPRTILKRQVARAADMGFAVKAGSEFEFFVLKDSWEELAERGWPVPRTFGHYNEDYHLLQATKAEPLHKLLRTQMSAANVPIEFSKGEAANGQHEVNIRYDHVLESADRSVVFKHGAKEIAYLNGWGITFMAKPDHRWTGSSGHLHMSVWDAAKDVPLMHATGKDPAGPYGLSTIGQQFMAGMMALSRELHQLLQALRLAVLGAGQRGLGPRQPDHRFPARGPGQGAPRGEPLPGRRHERVPHVRGDGRGRPVRHRARAATRTRVQGQRLPGQGPSAHAPSPVRGDPRAGAVSGRA
jgi:glutamine synthetase